MFFKIGALKNFCNILNESLYPLFFIQFFIFSSNERPSKTMKNVFFFLSAIWLPHSQLWDFIKGQFHSPNVNHCSLHFRPEGHREPCNKVGSLSPAEHLVGFEPRTFRFLLQHVNPLGHSHFSFHLKSSFHSRYI